jgi:hypothetical protein
MKSACRGFNQLSTTRVAGRGMARWARSEKSRFSARIVLVNFWDFYIPPWTFYVPTWTFISHLELLYPAKSTFILHGPCKELCSPCHFFPQKRYKTAHNIKLQRTSSSLFDYFLLAGYGCYVCLYRHVIIIIIIMLTFQNILLLYVCNYFYFLLLHLFISMKSHNTCLLTYFVS